MNKQRATSYDVARLAGVSQSAVSRTFSKGGSVSKKTRERVMAAANELGFKPNPIAQSLSLGRSKLVGLVITQYAHQNYPVALKSAVDVLGRTGQSLLVQVVDSESLADEAIAKLISDRVDMIISTADVSEKTAATCTASNVPLVLINRHVDVSGIDHVASNHRAIMADIAGRLAATGARRVLFLEACHKSWVSDERKAGLIEGCRSHDMDAPTVRAGGFSYQGGFDVIDDLGDDVRAFDAVVSANDPMALGALDALRLRLGLRVPEDIMVVGHDNTPIGRQLAYDLTSVQQQMGRMLETAVELGFARLNGETSDANLVFEAKIVARSSAPLGG